MKRLSLICVAALVTLGAQAQRARAEELPPKYQAAVNKGLEWLAKQQYRDGHWDANGGQYPMAMTALAGMALLMEGSTIREGKYADKIRRAVDWFISRSQRNGLLGNPNNPMEGGRYMYGHGFGTLFLASVYGEEEDADRRKKLEDVLTRAVQFIGEAQSTTGGWNYVSNKDGGGDGHEGSVTITQMQALRAARIASDPAMHVVLKAYPFEPRTGHYIQMTSPVKRPAVRIGDPNISAIETGAGAKDGHYRFVHFGIFEACRGCLPTRLVDARSP